MLTGLSHIYLHFYRHAERRDAESPRQRVQAALLKGRRLFFLALIVHRYIGLVWVVVF